MFPPSEACLYGCIKWFLAQAQQQSSMGLSLFFLLRGVARPDQGLGSISQCRRDLCLGLVVHLWQRGLTWRVGMRLIQVARSLLVVVSPPVLLILGGKGSVGVSAPDVSWSSASLSSSSAVVQVGMLFKFFDQWRSITANSFVLYIIWGHHLQLQAHLPLSVTFASLMSRWLTLIIQLFRRKWMSCLLREQLNHLLVVLFLF